MRVESGPAQADRNWHLVRMILFLGFAGYFVYDGAIGYPNKNKKEAELWLQQPHFAGQVSYDELGESPNSAVFAELAQQVQTGEATTRQDVHAVLGEPQIVDRTDDSDHTTEYFFSKWGRVIAEFENGRIVPGKVVWNEWDKTREEVQGQFYWAIIPALPGLYFLWRLYQAATLRVVVDDEGLTYSGKRIPAPAMVSLRDYNPKGWIDLYYEEGGKQQKLRLDNEKVAKFDEIVAAICELKGFENEVAEYAEEVAQSHEEQEAAAAAEDGEDAEPEPDADPNREK